MNRLSPIPMMLVLFVVPLLAAQPAAADAALDLYCEGRDWGSDRPKHIRVSIDRANQVVAITDPLRDAPRYLELVETRTLYRARGDHASGFVDLGKEKMPVPGDQAHYCKFGGSCEAYVIYPVDFKLNRQNGKFEYMVAGEIREEGSNALLKELDGWGIFRGAYCRELKQKF